MTRPGWNRLVLGAVVVPILGVAFAAASVFLLGAGDRAGGIIAYAISTMPLAAALGAAGAYLAGRAPGAPWVAGAAFALIGAVIAAMAAAIARFRQTGAVGFVSLAALPYTAEFLMLAGVIPAVLVLGAGVGRRQVGQGPRSVVGWSLAAGVASSAFVGLTLIAVRELGRLPVLNPVVIWILICAGIAVIGWRRLDSRR